MINPFLAVEMAVVHYNHMGLRYFTKEMVVVASDRIESIKPQSDQIDGSPVSEIFMASGDSILVYGTVIEIIEGMDRAVRQAPT